jgi:hypothetical protein
MRRKFSKGNYNFPQFRLSDRARPTSVKEKTMNRHRLLSCVFLPVFIVVIACQTLFPSSVSAAKLRVAGTRTVEATGNILGISPDGKRLLALSDDGLCSYDVETLDRQACATFRAPIDRRNLSWSPDGTRIAFTEDSLIRLQESDIWVMDVRDGSLKNLTDDSAEGNILSQEPGTPVDIAPSWSPDGKRLVFSRSYYPSDARSTVLCSIASDGSGAPEDILMVDDDAIFSIWTPIFWVDGGKTILYTFFANEFKNPDNGIWTADRSGRNQRKLADTDTDFGPPVVLDATIRGKKALVLYMMAFGQYANAPDVSYYYLLDLTTGEMTPLKEAAEGSAEFFGPLSATLSPDGSKVAYIYREKNSRELRLAVKDIGGGEENVLMSPEAFFWSNPSWKSILEWTSNDTIFYLTSADQGILVNLGSS